ncbi:TPA: hypothetical protein KOY50_002683 [Clostridioides difficile]|uniref:hypothetical protein n=1 Tax=Clostridioides TaxID=1870884 RepID=UPI00038D1247|nr:hypothetical protein [Clostridioides difficile]MCC0638453.1 hypothetical protein [Clostridioides sp. ES-S-0001-02]MCC0652234.1 hypothetical protein [Clostridioides sp. ES-S-0001-03]MCC0658594.1 hypothetical protein [Clostridioides sp. ES-S-0123-01]MCC0697488.1 hypothetical protein [Clostridioides sp. ES-S-0048-02]MCC0765129.1 hypothetical protein [Clostridioides sp. ES-S-0006-03]
MDLEVLKNIKIELREEQSPFFSDDEITYYYNKNNQDFKSTMYELCILKAENDSITLPGGLSMPENKLYWLTLAKKYKTNGSRCL